MRVEMHTINMKTRKEAYNDAIQQIAKLPGIFVYDEAKDEYCNLYVTQYVYRGYLIKFKMNQTILDSEHPGILMFNIRKIMPDGYTAQRLTEWEAYETSDSFDRTIERYESQGWPGDGFINAIAKFAHDPALATDVQNIVTALGGIREKKVVGQPFFMREGHTWNPSHQVVSVIALYADENGHRDSFDVDLATHSICG